MNSREVMKQFRRFGSFGFVNGDGEVFVRELGSTQRYHVVVEGRLYELSKTGFIQFLKKAKEIK